MYRSALDKCSLLDVIFTKILRSPSFSEMASNSHPHDLLHSK